MTAADLHASLTARGFRVSSPDGAKLLVGPQGKLTDVDRAEIARHKAGLLALLAAGGVIPPDVQDALDAVLPRSDCSVFFLVRGQGDRVRPVPWLQPPMPPGCAYRPAGGTSCH